MRGILLIVAATIAAELGDLTRFETPEKLMSFLGLIPSEYSSGAKLPQSKTSLILIAISFGENGFDMK